MAVAKDDLGFLNADFRLLNLSVARAPGAKVVLVQHTDNLARAGVTVVPFDEVDVSAALKEVLKLCEKRMPPELEKPAQEEVEQEIAELEYRLEHLRRGLGTREGASSTGL